MVPFSLFSDFPPGHGLLFLLLRAGWEEDLVDELEPRQKNLPHNPPSTSNDENDNGERGDNGEDSQEIVHQARHP
jgi:hypothetical protein